MRGTLRLRQFVVPFVSAVLAVLVTVLSLSAHDFWLVPNAFAIAEGDEIEVSGQTSSRFPASESALAVDRVADARILDASGETVIRNLSHAGKSLLIRNRPATPGQKVIEVSQHGRSVRESAESFRRYLLLEGAPEALERYEREGRLPRTDSLTRRYAKYAKTIVEVGRGGPRAFERVAGYPLEFVPLRDPATVRTGDTLAVRLLYQGRALPGAPVHAGRVPTGSGGSPPAATVEMNKVTLVTDAEGIVRLPVTDDGMWNVRTIHVLPSSPGSGADWDTHWGTLVFGVGPAMPSARSAGTAGADSTAVVAVVDRFHQALAAGDSATAVALLTPDAVILESGGVETPAEYRSHHLPGDIAFAQAVQRERGPTRVRSRGDIAWATSTSTATGAYQGRNINLQGAELMVLSRETGGWKIRAIHWSSRARRP